MSEVGASRLRRFGLAALGIAVALIGPIFIPSYWLTILTLAVIMAIFAIGLNLLMGYTGLDSLGQAAFFGSAAYFLGIMTSKYGLSWWLAALGGLLLATALALTFGLIAVRLKGLYFLLITLAFAQVLWGVTLRWGTFTGGWNGLRGVPRPLEELRRPIVFYYMGLAVLALVGGAVTLIANSPFGLALKGIRERELRSMTLGFNTRWHKYAVFVIAGAIAAVAGILSATYNGFVSPRDLSLELSFDAMLMVILGGTGTLLGPVVGALIVTALEYLLSVYIDNYWLIVLGLVFIGVTIWMPDGVMGVVRRLQAREQKRPTIVESNLDETAALDRGDRFGATQPLRFEGTPTTERRSGEDSLSLTDISKLFGDVQVLDGMNLTISTGERVGIIGLNGAGKTTLFDVITGIHPPTTGSIALFGGDVTQAPAYVRNRLGLARTFQVTTLYPKLTAKENVTISLLGRRYRLYQFSMWRRLAGLTELQARSDQVLSALGLFAFADVEVQYLSYGHQRQVEIALALAAEPDLLLLDEPTAGLSQAEIPTMLRLLKGLPADLSILIVEHNLEVIFELVDRVVVLHQGRVLRDGSPSQIRDDPEIRGLYFGTHATSLVATRSLELEQGGG